MIVSYSRTSSVDQQYGLEDQERQLREAGAEKQFSEKVSSVAQHRPEFERMMAFVREGDTIIITKPDRLARNVVAMMEIVDQLKAKGVQLRILSLGVDTATTQGRLILAILAAVAEWELVTQKERAQIGIAAARAAGKFKGRTPSVRNHLPTILKLKAEGHSNAEIARQIGGHATNVFRALKWHEEHEAAKRLIEAEASPPEPIPDVPGVMEPETVAGPVAAPLEPVRESSTMVVTKKKGLFGFGL